jgi:hypothetical protein
MTANQGNDVPSSNHLKNRVYMTGKSEARSFIRQQLKNGSD